MIYYMGVDPSIENTGCVVMNKDYTQLGAIEPSRYVENRALLKHKVLRYGTIAHKLVELIWFPLEPGSTIILCYEDYSFHSTNKSYSLGEMGGVLKTALLTMPQINVALYLVPPLTLKLFATGNGGASKNMMLKAFRGDIPEGYLPSPSTDIVDAYYLAMMSLYVKKEYPSSIQRGRVEVISKFVKKVKPITNY